MMQTGFMPVARAGIRAPDVTRDRSIGGLLPYSGGAMIGGPDASWTDFSLNDSLEIPNRDNLHLYLKELMEKFGINLDSSNIIEEMIKKEQGTQFLQQLQLLKFTIINSSKLMFDINKLKLKYPLVVYFIKEYHMKSKKNKLEQKDESESNSQKIRLDEVDYNELFKGFNANTMGNLSIADILRFKSYIAIQTRDKNHTEMTINRFNEEISSRNLATKTINPDSEEPVTVSKEPLNKTLKDLSVFSKTSLLEVIEEMDSMYKVISNRNEWKNHIEYISSTIKSSFENYCKASHKYQKLMIIKSQLENWILEYDKLINLLETKSDIVPIINQNDSIDHTMLSKLLSNKHKTDQLFFVDAIKSLNIDEIIENMRHEAQIFGLHYKLVDDLIKPFTKPNNCKICLLNIADQFIDTCGHIICKLCADQLINDNSAMMYSDNNTNGSPCPYCTKIFNIVNLKKIFY